MVGPRFVTIGRPLQPTHRTRSSLEGEFRLVRFLRCVAVQLPKVEVDLGRLLMVLSHRQRKGAPA